MDGEPRPDAGGLVEIRVLRVPVHLWQLAQEHVDDLLREFALVVQDEEARAATPRRLLSLIRQVRESYGQFSAEQRMQMEAALERGEREIDLTYHVPAGVAGAVRQLADTLDEADAYCEHGDLLLTLSSPPAVRRFRRWFVGEFVGQVAGRPPTAWPDYSDDS